MRKLASVLLSLAILCASLSLSAFAEDESSSDASSSSSESSESSQPAEEDAESEGTGSGEAPGSVALGSTNLSAATSYRPPFEDELHSKAIYMLNLDSDQPVYERNAQEQISPASLTKIMTCILALENVEDLDNEYTDLKAYIQNELYNLQVDTLGGIYLNESLCLRDLLYAMMLQSANEAAMMVADYVSDGSPEYFCELMNKKAQEIGAYNTHFANATGLYNAESYTTAYDMAQIAKYAAQMPEFMEIVTTNTYTSQPTDRHPDGITWYTINNMQRPGNEDYYEGLRGIKTGSLPEQNIRNYVSTATRDGYTYLLVCLGAPDHNEEGLKYANFLPWIDTQKLYDWAFETFRVKTLMEIGAEAAEVPVRLSWDVDHVKLLAADKFATLVPNEVNEDTVVADPVIPEYIDAPVEKGEPVGYVRLMLSGQEIGRVDLVAASNVERSAALYYLDKVKSFFDTFLFKFIFTFVIVILVLYIALMIVRNHNRRRYQNRRRRPPQTPQRRR